MYNDRVRTLEVSHLDLLLVCRARGYFSRVLQSRYVYSALIDSGGGDLLLHDSTHSNHGVATCLRAVN